MHETSVQIPSNLLFEPPELTRGNLSPANTERSNHCQPHPKAHGTSFASRRRAHHGKAATGLSEVFEDVDRTCGWKADLLGCRKSAGTPDARISRMSRPSALNGKDTKHPKNANLGNSTSVFPDPKSVSRMPRWCSQAGLDPIKTLDKNRGANQSHSTCLR